jgi:hypothetical protein
MSNAQRSQDPEQELTGRPGCFMLQGMKDKAEACRDMAECLVCPVQLDLISSLVSNQIVHVSSSLEATAQNVRTFDRGEHGDAARAEDVRLTRDLIDLLADLCDLAVVITGKLEKLGAA